MGKIDTKKDIEENFTSKFGEVPKNEYELKKYIQHIKENYWIVESENRLHNDLLKQENEKLINLLEKGKSKREKELELKVFTLDMILRRTRISLRDALDCSDDYFEKNKY